MIRRVYIASLAKRLETQKKAGGKPSAFFVFGVISSALAKKTLELIALVPCAQLTNCLFLDLTNSLASESELIANLLERHLRIRTNPEEELYNLSLTLRKCREHSINLCIERVAHQRAVCAGSIFVYEYIQETIVLAIHKGGIYRDMLTE